MEKPIRPHRGIYLLPNLLTTLGLFAGFYAIIAGIEGHFTNAAKAIFVAILADMLDGQVARLTRTQSDFGKQYDSLVDMVAFGLAPSVLAYMWALSALDTNGWLASFVYVAASSLRLARFNVQAASFNSRNFQGLTSPAAAALLAATIWLGDAHEWLERYPGWTHSALFVLTITVSALMVSTIRYRSYKDVDLKYQVPFVAVLAVVMLFVLISFNPPLILFGAFLIYVFSGPWRSALRWRRKHQLRKRRRLRRTGSSG